MRRVLIVAFQFPPFGGGSGLLRVLKFCRYLPESGWQPIVLTANPRVYENLEMSLMSEIRPDVQVTRAFALDTQKHLSIGGRYARWMSLPDRWVSWIVGAIPAGWKLIRRNDVDVIMSTFPITTAVLIGLILHKLSGKLWIVDFRDPMTEDNYPNDPAIHKVWRSIEALTIRHASFFTFTSKSAMQDYLRRYPQLRVAQCRVIPNGYDEEDFQFLSLRGKQNGLPLRLLHAGVIYPDERDPRPFFKALARLKASGEISEANLRIELRASGSEEYYESLLRKLGVNDLVHLLPSLPYRESLQNSSEADALLLIQAANCDHQIPAKAYEYLRLRKPILALTSHTGDTAALLREGGGATILDLADEEEICEGLPRFLRAVGNSSHPLPNSDFAKHYSRQNQTHELASCLNAILQSEGVR